MDMGEFFEAKRCVDYILKLDSEFEDALEIKHILEKH